MAGADGSSTPKVALPTISTSESFLLLRFYQGKTSNAILEQDFVIFPLSTTIKGMNRIRFETRLLQYQHFGSGIPYQGFPASSQGHIVLYVLWIASEVF